jgi:hypothetical protein
VAQLIDHHVGQKAHHDYDRHAEQLVNLVEESSVHDQPDAACNVVCHSRRSWRLSQYLGLMHELLVLADLSLSLRGPEEIGGRL